MLYSGKNGVESKVLSVLSYLGVGERAVAPAEAERYGEGIQPTSRSGRRSGSAVLRPRSFTARLFWAPFTLQLKWSRTSDQSCKKKKKKKRIVILFSLLVMMTTMSSLSLEDISPTTFTLER